MTEPPTHPAGAAWAQLDRAWKLAFEGAWEAVRTGNIGVGAVATDPDGAVMAVGRNRVAETEPPLGQLAGTSLAHAEMNVLAQLPFRSPKNLVLSTTLEPCLQCSAAIRLGPISQIRFAGRDPFWEGCADFTSLGPWLARREPVPREGPLPHRLGWFAVMLARFGPGLTPHVESARRQDGEGPLIDLANQLEHSGRWSKLLELDVAAFLVEVWDHLGEAADAMTGPAPER